MKCLLFVPLWVLVGCVSPPEMLEIVQDHEYAGAELSLRFNRSGNNQVDVGSWPPVSWNQSQNGVDVGVTLRFDYVPEPEPEP